MKLKHLLVILLSFTLSHIGKAMDKTINYDLKSLTEPVKPVVKQSMSPNKINQLGFAAQTYQERSAIQEMADLCDAERFFVFCKLFCEAAIRKNREIRLKMYIKALSSSKSRQGNSSQEVTYAPSVARNPRLRQTENIIPHEYGKTRKKVGSAKNAPY